MNAKDLGLYLFFRPRKFVDLWQRSQEKQQAASENVENEEDITGY